MSRTAQGHVDMRGACEDPGWLGHVLVLVTATRGLEHADGGVLRDVVGPGRNA